MDLNVLKVTYHNNIDTQLSRNMFNQHIDDRSKVRGHLEMSLFFKALFFSNDDNIK